VAVRAGALEVGNPVKLFQRVLIHGAADLPLGGRSRRPAVPAERAGGKRHAAMAQIVLGWAATLRQNP
jgi:hypothetical protein